MSRWLALGFWAVVAGQVALLLVLIGMKEQTLRTGTTVVLQAVPVDPRSLFQGDYTTLGYEISQLPPNLSDLRLGARAYVSLVEKGEVWVALRYGTAEPSGDQVYIKGIVGRRGRLDFGIGTYFVPEGTGRVIERAEDVKVEVAIDGGGNALIKQVLVDGRPFEPVVPKPPERIPQERRPNEKPPVPLEPPPPP